uniref:Uncharacterized protein n=1 Tax=Arundo donax TaxID=35708 RepID=A0A0A9B8W3_ARUDO
MVVMLYECVFYLVNGVLV